MQAGAPMLHTSGGVCVRLGKQRRRAKGGQCGERVMDAALQKKSASRVIWGHVGTLGGRGH